MITVSDELKAAFLCGNQKHLVLTFSDGTQQVDEDIYLESMEIEQSLCEEEQLTYGTTSAASFKIRILNSGKKFKGLGVSVAISTVGDDDLTYTASLGNYKVYEDVLSDDRNYRDLTCYDAFHGILDAEYATWYNALTFPMTMKQFRDAFFSHVGLTQRTVVLACDNISIPANTVDSISGATIIQSICEPSGAFCFVDYDGYVQYVILGSKAGLYPRTDLYPDDDLYPRVAYDDFFDDTDENAAPVQDGTVYGDYDCRRISEVRVARDANGSFITVGTTGNTYQFANNPLFTAMSTSTLESIGRTFIDVVSEIVYKPSRVKGRARVWVQLGDMIGVATQMEQLVFPVLHREMSGITALYDTYEANGKEYYEFDANSLENRMDQAEYAISDNASNIADLDDDINNPTTGVKVTFKQQIDSLEATVAGTTEIWDETNYNISVYGYDTPDNEGYTPSSYTNQYYLNQTTGYVYQSNGSAWNYVAALTKIQAALQSQITQNAGQISLKVSKGSVSSEISQEAGQITLSAGRLIINSGNFRLDSSGNARAVNFEADQSFVLYQNKGINPTVVTYLTSDVDGELKIGSTSGGTHDGTVRCNTLSAQKIYATDGGSIKVSGYDVISTRNIGSQSVSYANTAGSANSVSWSNVSGKPTIPSDYLTGVSSGGRESGTGKYMVHSVYKSGSNVEYTTMEVTNASDRRLKIDIEKLDDFTDLYMELGVYKFKYNQKLKSTRMRDYVHYGIMAQDTMALYEKYGIPSEKISLFYKESCDEVQAELTGDKTYWSMNRDELHALHIQMIQKQQKKIDNLELEVSELKAKLKEVVNVG